ncbi:MAG TPA: plasmid stabilization protein [Aquabacterium sp.]|nr:plasmid stabilization protein [Aquabacterium sp.]
MAQLATRNLEDDAKVRVRRRAAAHGTSQEGEVRRVLRHAVAGDDTHASVLGSPITTRFARVRLTEPIPELTGQGIHAIAPKLAGKMQAHR